MAFSPSSEYIDLYWLNGTTVMEYTSGKVTNVFSFSIISIDFSLYNI